MEEWIWKVRCRNLNDLLEALRRKLLSCRNYDGVIGNSPMLSRYYYEVVRLLHKWLNRRSQRRPMTRAPARLGASAAAGGEATAYSRVADGGQTCMMETKIKPATSVASDARSPRNPVR